MEYVYAALTLNEADAEITEDNITAVLEAAGISCRLKPMSSNRSWLISMDRIPMEYARCTRA